jgi:acyl-CoA thioesterase FadM
VKYLRTFQFSLNDAGPAGHVPVTMILKIMMSTLELWMNDCVENYQDAQMAVHDVNLTMIKHLLPFDRAGINLKVELLRGASGIVHLEVTKGGEVHAHGSIEVVFFRNGKPCRMPQNFREAGERYNGE